MNKKFYRAKIKNLGKIYTLTKPLNQNKDGCTVYDITSQHFRVTIIIIVIITIIMRVEKSHPPHIKIMLVDDEQQQQQSSFHAPTNP